MITPETIRKQIEVVITDLISNGLSVDQNFPSIRSELKEIKVDFGKSDISIALKKRPYREI